MNNAANPPHNKQWIKSDDNCLLLLQIPQNNLFPIHHNYHYKSPISTNQSVISRVYSIMNFHIIFMTFNFGNKYI